MTGQRTGALARLREIRDELGAGDAPRRVNLRDYAAPGSAAWDAFVEASGQPGHNVRLNTMVARINQAIDALTSQLLGAGAPPATAAPRPEAPSPHEAHEAGRPAGAAADDAPGEPEGLRRLTSDGIGYARTFLAGLREDPGGPIEPPRELLYGDAYSAPFPGEIEVERRSFRTRREAAEYLAPRLEPVSHLVVDQGGVWSWLGMFYFPGIVTRRDDGAVRLSPVDETLIMSGADRQRHYLWSAWRLYVQHGERAAFLLDEGLTSFTRIARRPFQQTRAFNSIGLVPLILRLYTGGGRAKPGFSAGDAPGGLDHLFRVLDQLERTYDVYGMEPDALMRVLPSEFRAWDGGPGLRRDAGAAATPRGVRGSEGARS